MEEQNMGKDNFENQNIEKEVDKVEMDNNNLENQNTEKAEVNQEKMVNNLEKQDSENSIENGQKSSNGNAINDIGDKIKKKFPFIKTFRKLFLTIILIVSIVFIAYLAFKKLTYKEKIDLKAIPTVNVTHIKIGKIEKEISVNGEIKPNDIYYVISKVGGDIKKIYVKNGDHVKKGDPICDIDASKEIEAAFIEYDTAKNNFERMQKLYVAGDISKQNYEQVKAQYDSKKLAYDTKVEYSTVVAVDDGVIENTDMILNTAISTGKVLCYITSNAAKEIEFGVTERVLNGISMGEKVVIEKGGVKYEGRVSNISKLISQDGLFHVKAVILSKNNFAAGINATVTFVYDSRINTQILSNNVLYYETGQAYIFVVDENNVTRKKYIEVGIENKDITEILTKIDKKEKIVSTWNKDLAEGSPVKIGIDEEVIDDIEKETEKEIKEDEVATIEESVVEEALIDKKVEEENVSDVDKVIDELGEKLGITIIDEENKKDDKENIVEDKNESKKVANQSNDGELVKENNEVESLNEGAVLEKKVDKVELETEMSSHESTVFNDANIATRSVVESATIKDISAETRINEGALSDNMIIDSENASFMEVK